MKSVTIYSYSIVYASSEAFASYTPYICAILAQEDGQKFAGILGGYREGMQIAIGQKAVPAGDEIMGHPVYRLLENG